MVLETLLWIGAGSMFALFGSIGLFTLWLAVTKRRADRHRTEVRERLRTALFDRQEWADPGWEKWVASLSPTEKVALGRLIERYLRLITGPQREPLLAVARELQVGEDAVSQLDSPNKTLRLTALATLTVLDHPVTVDRLLETCTDRRDTREAAARLIYERRTEFTRPSEWGTKLLLWEGEQPLTVYGLETLALLNSGKSTPLLGHGQTYSPIWSPSLLVQTCTVLAHCQSVEPPSAFDWVFPLLEHEEPSVRAAAVGVFAQQGWRRELRNRLDIAALFADPSPVVRTATYELLTGWGDRQARELLEWAVIDEADQRCQMIAVRGLALLAATPRREQPAWPESAWNWHRAELEVTTETRLQATTKALL